MVAQYVKSESWHFWARKENTSCKAAKRNRKEIILPKSSSTLPRRTENRFAPNRFAFKAPPGLFCQMYRDLLGSGRPGQGVSNV